MSNISRRDFLKTAGVMSLAVALAGCDTAASSSSSETPAVVTPTASNSFEYTVGNDTLKVSVDAYGEQYRTTGVKDACYAVFTFTSQSTLPDASRIAVIQIRDKYNRIVTDWETGGSSSQPVGTVYPVLLDTTNAAYSGATETDNKSMTEDAIDNISITYLTDKKTTVVSHNSADHTSGSTTYSATESKRTVCYTGTLTIDGEKFYTTEEAATALKSLSLSHSSTAAYSEYSLYVSSAQEAAAGKVYLYAVEEYADNSDNAEIVLYSNYKEAAAAATKTVTVTCNAAEHLNDVHGLDIDGEAVVDDTDKLSCVGSQFTTKAKTEYMIRDLCAYTMTDGSYNAEDAEWTVLIWDTDNVVAAKKTLTVSSINYKTIG